MTCVPLAIQVNCFEEAMTKFENGGFSSVEQIKEVPVRWDGAFFDDSTTLCERASCANTPLIRPCPLSLQEEGGRIKSFLEYFKEMGELQTYTWTNSMGESPPSKRKKGKEHRSDTSENVDFARCWEIEKKSRERCMLP